MSKFNLEDYETVKERKQRFYKDFPDGRIVVTCKNDSSAELMDFAKFEARVYLNAQDQEKDLPRGTGTALEMRDKELSRTSGGKTYESVNYSSWTENCEESAVGRALDNAGYASNGKPSREEMEKVGRNIKAIRSQNAAKEGFSTKRDEVIAENTKYVRALYKLLSDAGVNNVKATADIVRMTMVTKKDFGLADTKELAKIVGELKDNPELFLANLDMAKKNALVSE